MKTFDEIVAEALRRNLRPELVVIYFSRMDGSSQGRTEPLPYEYALARLEILKRENPKTLYWLDEVDE